MEYKKVVNTDKVCNPNVKIIYLNKVNEVLFNKVCF